MIVNSEAFSLLESASKKFIAEGDFGPRREAARAVIDLFTLNADYALPMFEIAEKAVGIYEINHGYSESRGVNKASVTKVVKEMLNGRGANKFLRVHKDCGTAISGVYELNY